MEKVINETVFSANQAASGGAILVSNKGNDPSLPLIIDTSAFEHNRASSGSGSAVMQQDAGTMPGGWSQSQNLSFPRNRKFTV